MRALIVGAGAVGQVYGRHLALGGAEVTFLVKPKYAAGARAGFTLYPQNRRRARRAMPESFSDFTVVTSADEVAQSRWDAAYLTMSSPALRAEDAFARLAPALGDATVVMLQPGPEDAAFVLRHVAAERLVQGIITIISYHGPLPGETRLPRPGVVYWFAPLAKSPLSGEANRVAAVVNALTAGGLPAREVRAVGADAAFATAMFMPLIAALEAADWSFDKVRRGAYLERAQRAAAEGRAIVAAHERRPSPRLLSLLPLSLAVRAFLPLAPTLFPFDLEAYLKLHFTKFGEQTREALATLHAWGQASGLPTTALGELTETIARRP